MNMRLRIPFLCFAFCLLPLFSFSKGILVIRVQPVFRGKPLILNDKTYVSEYGESMTIEEFKFYISNLQLIGTSTSYLAKNSAFLINAEDTATLTLRIENIPSGIYNQLGFEIGLDSVTNVSGALGGDLDPTKGMYWAWNTGYINAKLTGYSKSCPTLHNKFEFHIGGYTEPYIALRKAALMVPELNISEKAKAILTLEVDISAWFSGIHLFSMNNIVTPSKESLRIADNYMTMFKVSKPDEGGK
ncbi:hypothetical protein EMGBS15_14140 [Filimonas sp.]|nr:hypothetical protein EMGBS15_14140 [Filimonas sp.]